MLPFPAPTPPPSTPTSSYAVPRFGAASGGAVVYSASTSAGPDESFFVTGTHLGKQVRLWGPGRSTGTLETRARVLTGSDNDLIGVVPEGTPDGLYVGEVCAGASWGSVFRLNAPQPWWCGPDRTTPGEPVDLIGDELAELPDRVQSWVYVENPGRGGAWAATTSVSRYRVTFTAPSRPGHYSVWVYAGNGGAYGWGGPVPLDVAKTVPSSRATRLASAALSNRSLQNRLDTAGRGTEVRIVAGTYWLDRSLVVPAGVTLRGATEGATVLRLRPGSATGVVRAGGVGFGKAVSSLQDAGDSLTYRLSVPRGGAWSFWVRYASDNMPYGLADMSGHTTVQIDGGPATPLEGLLDTGGWDTFRWAKSARLQITRGVHTLRWVNLKGGGITLDAFALARDAAWMPPPSGSVSESPQIILIQAENPISSITVQAQFPGAAGAVVWLSGVGASLRDLSIIGTPETNTGVGIEDLRHGSIVEDNRVEAVRVSGIEGEGDENTGIRLVNVRYAVVRGCDVTARAPFLIEGMAQSRLAHNWLHAVTRWGGNSEAAILGRTHALHQNIIEDNVVDSPEGAGGPTARRLLWFSTGHGSVTDNYISGNVGRTAFGGVAGTDQNVGETILFETNMRVAYYGRPLSAAGNRLELPAQGVFWPRLRSGGSEPPQDEYYVYVVRGRGLGQVRRVTGRRGNRLVLDEPWDVPPDGDSMVLESLTFAHNIVVGNQVSDGMSGIQLWIGGFRNIFAENRIENERRQGIYLFGAMSTSETSMTNHWNSGIGPLFYNSVEGNQIRQVQQGILVGIGDDAAAAKGADWPRALGTVIRHNTVVHARSIGIEISGGPSTGPDDLAIEGTLVDFDMVRDSPTAYLASERSSDTLFRRDFGYFWNQPPGRPSRAFVTSGARNVFGELNVIEREAGSDAPDITNQLSPVLDGMK